MGRSDVDASESLHPLAELYARWALNPLVEVACAVAYDVSVRPHQYRDLSDEVASVLSDFRFRLGSDPAWPDAIQRALSFKALYQVNLSSPRVRQAALVSAERREERARAGALREAASELRAQLEPLEGRALTMTCETTRPIFDRAVTVFQDPAVAGAFGLPPAPTDGWPAGGNFSGPAARLVAEMTRSLRNVACVAGVYSRLGANRAERPLMPLLTVALPQDKVLALQRAAYFGSLTLSRVLDGDDTASVEVADFASNWAGALQRLVPDVSRAWKDLDYRSRLSDLEWGLVPNPAGDAAPLMQSAGGAQTYTLHGEICCCSGDLDCVPETLRLTDFCSEFCGTIA